MKIKNMIALTVSMLIINTLSAQFNSLVVDSIYSNILKEQRQLLIYLPNDYVEKKDTTMHYPVLYVLDGASHFLSVSGLVNELAETSDSYTLPKMIVVFILHQFSHAYKNIRTFLPL